MSVPEFDDSEWPLLRVSFGVSMSPEDLDEYFKLAESFLQRREPFALVIDARRADVPDARSRARFSEFFAAQQLLTKRYLLGMAVVLNTSIGRGVVIALGWMQSAKFPVQSFASVAEASHWARAQLQPQTP